MLIASLFGKTPEVEKNKWNDDDDEQKKIFYEEDKMNHMEKSKQQFKCDITKSSDLVDCNCKNECNSNKTCYECIYSKI